MNQMSRFNELLNPLAVALRMMPRSGRLLMLGVAALLSAALLLLFNSSLNTLEQRLGALGWTLGSDDTLEQRLTIIAIDEKSIVFYFDYTVYYRNSFSILRCR